MRDFLGQTDNILVRLEGKNEWYKLKSKYALEIGYF